jgi:hypothetical protein
MTGSDEEFEDFLKRRKPTFRAVDDMFEPPPELDRVVLRQAREAIETEQPLRVFRGPRWAAPLALAATLVLAIAVVFQADMPDNRKPVAEVTVQNAAQRVDVPEATAPAAAAASTGLPLREEAPASDTSNEVIVDLAPSRVAGRERPAPVSVDGGLVSRDEADRYAAPSPSSAPMEARRAVDERAGNRRVAGAIDAPPVMVTVPAAKATQDPAWRRDSKTWLAEIERLRNAGDIERANAEFEEYKRQHRAYAVAPDQ